MFIDKKMVEELVSEKWMAESSELDDNRMGDCFYRC